MFLEAQFGSSSLTPIDAPRLPKPSASDASSVKNEPSDSSPSLDALEAAELERLHALGIPVPGVEIKVDKYVAKVWLEDLTVECASAVFGQRVRVVVERAVETVAPLWGRDGSGGGKGGGKKV